MQLFPSSNADEKLKSVKVIISHIDKAENANPIKYLMTLKSRSCLKILF